MKVPDNRGLRLLFLLPVLENIMHNRLLLKESNWRKTLLEMFSSSSNYITPVLSNITRLTRFEVIYSKQRCIVLCHLVAYPFDLVIQKLFRKLKGRFYGIFCWLFSRREILIFKTANDLFNAIRACHYFTAGRISQAYFYSTYLF